MEVRRVTSLGFDFYGVRLNVRSRDLWILERLKMDFAYFLSSRRAEPDILIHLHAQPPPPVPFRGFGWGWPKSQCRLYTRGDRRWVLYPQNALCLYDFAREQADLWCTNPALLHELSYLLIHSRVGEKLDLKGLHRVHALGFSFNGQGGLFVASSGGGKTTLCLELLRRPGFKILAEDVPLADRHGNLHPFPTRLGVRPDEAKLRHIPAIYQTPFLRRRHGSKILIGLEYFQDKISPSVPLRWIFLGQKTSSGPRIQKAGLGKSLSALSSALTLGWGVPQVLEYFLRGTLEGLAKNCRIVLDRSSTSWNLSSQACCRRFLVSPDAARNADCLSAFLKGNLRSR